MTAPITDANVPGFEREVALQLDDKLAFLLRSHYGDRLAKYDRRTVVRLSGDAVRILTIHDVDCLLIAARSAGLRINRRELLEAIGALAKLRRLEVASWGGANV